MSTDAACLFCKIVDGEIPADVVAQTDEAVAFRDVNPQAPTHALVVPRSHFADAAALADGEPDTLASMVRVARDVAHAAGLDDYRLVFNTGEGAGQTAGSAAPGDVIDAEVVEDEKK